MDAKIVHIDFIPSFSDHISEDVIHQCLEHGWGIAEAEEHYYEFKEPEGSNECSLPLISLTELNVVVFPMDIKLSKKGGVPHVIKSSGSGRG